MFAKMKKAVCVLIAGMLAAVLSVTAFADYTYQIEGDGLCDEIKAGTKEINGTEGVFETEFGDSTEEKYLSLRFKLFNEYLDLDFWKRDDVQIAVDVKLETEGANVIGCLPGFNSKWGWVNPSGYTNLKYGEWVTVSEKASHYYDEFSKSEPAYILFQVRTNWGAEAQGNVKVSVRNMRIIDGGESEAVTTPEQTTTTPEQTTTTPEQTTTTPEEQTPDTFEPSAADTFEVSAEPVAAMGTYETKDDNATASVTGEETGETKEAVTEPEPEQTTPSTTAQTTIRTAATAATSSSINYSELYSEPESPVMMIVIIVGAAVLISAGAIVGYMIYRKKKFY